MRGSSAAPIADLYERHAGLVLAICRRSLRDAAEAEDATQQTFLSAQRALQNGSQPRDPVAWLAAIARNECIARAQARARDPLPTAAETGATSPDVHAEALRREDVATLQEAIGSLPAQQREAILLRELRGLSYDEVAQSLALTPAAVESLLFRARRGLQVRLRSAWAALSPVGWLASARDLVVQLGAAGSPTDAPVAAKAVALGLGTAVLAGGALVGPRALGHGHGHLAAARPAAVERTRASTRRPAARPDASPPPLRGEPVAGAPREIVQRLAAWGSPRRRHRERSDDAGAHATTANHAGGSGDTGREAPDREASGSPDPGTDAGARTSSSGTETEDQATRRPLSSPETGSVDGLATATEPDSSGSGTEPGASAPSGSESSSTGSDSGIDD